VHSLATAPAGAGKAPGVPYMPRDIASVLTCLDGGRAACVVRAVSDVYGLSPPATLEECALRLWLECASERLKIGDVLLHLTLDELELLARLWKLPRAAPLFPVRDSLDERLDLMVQLSRWAANEGHERPPGA
jgi:hypothetical protein